MNRKAEKVLSSPEPYSEKSEVVEAVAILRNRGYPITLDLVGGAFAPAFKRMQSTLKLLDPNSEFVNYHGEIPYQELHKHYRMADLGLFASTCENMPNILIELMASGLPIACSNFGPMPEVLGDAGVYFNPERPIEISDALKLLIDNPDLRYSLSLSSHDKSKKYSWNQCADKTFSFLSGFLTK